MHTRSALILSALASPLGAQDPHAQHGRSAPRDTLPPDRIVESMVGPLGTPQAREGSGTARLPDASPMYAHHWQVGRWELTLHDNRSCGTSTRGVSSACGRW